MSTQEIIEVLTKLDPDELRQVKEKLAELEASHVGEPHTEWGKALLKIIGTAPDLPEDFSANHDHYLYGTPKRE